MSADLIRTRLTEALAPDTLEVIDNTHAHAGHAGVQNGGGHFHVSIVCRDFADKSLIQRHQMIYKALGGMMKNQIHALGIEAYSPSEINQGNK
jgi:BolA family transcriptional regulator, general stress-responsive regulator